MTVIPLTHGLSARIVTAQQKMEQIMEQIEAEEAFQANLRGFPMECAVFGHSYPVGDFWYQVSEIDWQTVSMPSETCVRCGAPHID